MRLTDDELRDVLARAEEIQRASEEGQDMRAELETVIEAAEEIGLARPAVERALRERLNYRSDLPTAGSLAYATSADGKSYVAEVLSISEDGARVRFLRGSEHEVTLDQLRPCNPIPGERVVCNWPWWGPWTCTITRYDAAHQWLELSDGWGSTHICALADVWLAPPKKAESTSAVGRRAWMLLGAGAGVGALIGSIITGMFLR